MKVKWKKAAALVLAAAVAVTSSAVIPQMSLESEAKTQNSTPAQNVFFYAKNDQGKSVLMKIIDIEELESSVTGKYLPQAEKKIIIIPLPIIILRHSTVREEDLPFRNWLNM